MTKNCSTCDGSRIHDGTRCPKEKQYKGKMYCIFWGDGALGEWTEPYGFCHKWKPKKPELWATGKTYAKGEQVVFGDVVYQVLVGHESSEFNVPGMCEKYKPVRFIKESADETETRYRAYSGPGVEVRVAKEGRSPSMIFLTGNQAVAAYGTIMFLETRSEERGLP